MSDPDHEDLFPCFRRRLSVPPGHACYSAEQREGTVRRIGDRHELKILANDKVYAGVVTEMKALLRRIPPRG